MIHPSENNSIYVYTTPTDMRKSINGLVILLCENHEQNPKTGDLFIFTNKQRNKLKLLYWDHNGFMLCYKRLERGRFQYSPDLRDDSLIITEAQCRALLMGLDFYLMGQYPQKSYEIFF